jgi:NADH-quinone oxidoreductase subunit M
VNEFLVLRGAFNYEIFAGAIAALAIILGAAYMLRLTQKVMYGPLASHVMEELTDINTRERLILIAFVVLIFVVGVFPNLLLHFTEPSVNQGLLDIQRASAPGT